MHETRVQRVVGEKEREGEGKREKERLHDDRFDALRVRLQAGTANGLRRTES